MKYRKCLVVLIMVIVGTFIFSCAPKERKPLSRLDTPEHHTFTGIKLMDQGKYDDAEREFQLHFNWIPNFPGLTREAVWLRPTRVISKVHSN